MATEIMGFSEEKPVWEKEDDSMFKHMSSRWSERWGDRCPAAIGNVTVALRTESESEVILSGMEASPRPLRSRYIYNNLIPGPGLHASINQLHLVQRAFSEIEMD